MTSANHPRFRLLIGWCCLMSSVLLIITVYLIYNKGIPPKTGQNAKSEKSTAGNEVPNSSAIDDKTTQQIGHPSGSFSNDYMHLIRDPTEIWICHPCKNTSFSQKNSTVEITISGLYYFHAQVTFSHDNIQGTVILRKNKGPGIKNRILSRVKQYGTATMIHLVELKEGDSISLEIDPINSISEQDYDTYWEIIFFNNK
ncbi:lymphotoxin-alpha [Onychostoma macrolepis]|uniref:lymphotoxin-alpha n=1 Tax=Onychostoma macrolepis TaxID=369639 RepID=UPI00272B83AC|nr:lymphotoxin-alpha [Onychostoma macrolepis]